MGNSCLCKICKNCLDNKTITIIENNSTKILEKGFYDMILDFSNFEQLKKDGWKITFGPDCEKKYENCKSNNNVVIGIIGNNNRGKSFLLGKIIGNINYSAESGFLVTTKGISANFPTIDEKKNNLNVITLDTAGKDNPLLDSGNFNIPFFNDFPENNSKKSALVEPECLFFDLYL